MHSMEEAKRSQDMGGEILAKAAILAQANRIDDVTLILYREVFDILDIAVSKRCRPKRV